MQSDIQTITIDGFPAGGSFTLDFNGQTTSTIPVTPIWATIPSAAYVAWTIPVTPGTAYLVAVDMQNRSDLYSSIAATFMDGSSIIAATQFSEADGDYDYTVSGETYEGGSLYMKNLATVTPTTSSLVILFSFAAGGTGSLPGVILDAISLTDVATSATTYYGCTDETATHSLGLAPVGPNEGYYGDGYSFYSPYTPLSTGLPAPSASASAIQSALLALSSVQSGGLTVTDSSGVDTGPFSVDFTGPMANNYEPLMTSSDGSVTIAHTQIGSGGLFRRSLNNRTGCRGVH